MSEPTPASPSGEITFRSYSQEQGKSYARHRLSYHDDLYQAVMGYHKAGGARLDTLLDVGCGPGTAVRDLAPHFNHAIGLDPSDGMISTAMSLGGVSGSSEPIRFAVSGAEKLGSDLSPPVPDSSVDLIIAATCAHWFDMSRFWPQAARVVKPGGTVALWCGGSVRVDPAMPGHAAIQAAIDGLSQRIADYMEPGNRTATNLYADLPLPWSLETPVPEFDKATFLRKEWNTGDRYGLGDHFYAHQRDLTLDALEQVMGTMSPVTRWRQAHPDEAGTERDVVRMMRREIEIVLEDSGADVGAVALKGGVTGVLMMVKKKT